MKVVIKVGGSVLCPDDEPDMQFVSALSGVLAELSARHDMAVVVGGGRRARRMISEARRRTSLDDDLHEVGIKASRMNATALLSELGNNASPGIPRDAGEAEKFFEPGKILVSGGFRPGQTTDAAAAEIAKAIGADLLVIGTDVKGVYDRDPKTSEDAKLFREIAIGKLLEMVDEGGVSPGKKTIVDPVAAGIIRETGLKAVVLAISDLENLKNAIEGRDFTGTTVRAGAG
jgi:uridylate kinase